MKIDSASTGSRLLFALAILTLAGCEDSLTDVLDSDSGTIRVTLDAATCGTTVTGKLTPIIDGKPKNVWNNAKGGSSKDYLHPPGQFQVAAQWDVSAAGYGVLSFGPWNYTLYPSQTYTIILYCS